MRNKMFDLSDPPHRMRYSPLAIKAYEKAVKRILLCVMTKDQIRSLTEEDVPKYYNRSSYVAAWEWKPSWNGWRVYGAQGRPRVSSSGRLALKGTSPPPTHSGEYVSRQIDNKYRGQGLYVVAYLDNDDPNPPHIETGLHGTGCMSKLYSMRAVFQRPFLGKFVPVRSSIRSQVYKDASGNYEMKPDVRRFRYMVKIGQERQPGGFSGWFASFYRSGYNGEHWNTDEHTECKAVSTWSVPKPKYIDLQALSEQRRRERRRRTPKKATPKKSAPRKHVKSNSKRVAVAPVRRKKK